MVNWLKNGRQQWNVVETVSTKDILLNVVGEKERNIKDLFGNIKNKYAKTE